MGKLSEETASAIAEASPLAANLAWLLSQASYTLTTELTAALEGLGVSPRAYHVLKTAMKGEFTQTDLTKMIGLDKTTLVVTLDEPRPPAWQSGARRQGTGAPA